MGSARLSGVFRLWDGRLGEPPGSPCMSRREAAPSCCSQLEMGSCFRGRGGMDGLGAQAVNKGQHVWPRACCACELPGQVTWPLWPQCLALSDEGSGQCNCQGPPACFQPSPHCLALSDSSLCPSTNTFSLIRSGACPVLLPAPPPGLSASLLLCKHRLSCKNLTEFPA